MNKAPPILLALAGLVIASGCSDTDDPASPGLESVANEAVIDQAVDQVDAQDEMLFADAERTRQRDPRGDRPPLDRVKLALEISAGAVQLSGEILAREGADERQRALLHRAREFQRAAEEAFARSQPIRAVHLAQQAGRTALKAWVLPGGVTRAEAEQVQALASDLLAEATATVGDAGGVRGVLLAWAARFYEHGAEALEGGHLRGVAALWKSAVLSYFLVG